MLVYERITMFDDITKATKQDLADLLIKRLNEISKTDPTAMEWLLKNRVECNDALADHPTVQVNSEGDKPMVGMLGILNGLVGAIDDDGPKKGWGFIAAKWDDEQGFTGFVRTDKPHIKPA